MSTCCPVISYVRHGECGEADKDISTDLANVLWETVAVQVVVLDLKVLSERDENGQGELICLLVGHASLFVSLSPVP